MQTATLTISGLQYVMSHDPKVFTLNSGYRCARPCATRGDTMKMDNEDELPELTKVHVP